MKFSGKHVLIACSAIPALFLHPAQAADDCQLIFSTPNVSFGMFKQEDIVGTQKGWHRMPSRTVNVNISCQQSQVTGLFVQGRAGEQGRFYFGGSSGLAVSASQMMVDGKSYLVAKTLDRSSLTPDGESKDKIFLHNNEGIIAVDNRSNISGKQMNFTLTLTPILNDQQFGHAPDTTTLENDLIWDVITR